MSSLAALREIVSILTLKPREGNPLKLEDPEPEDVLRAINAVLTRHDILCPEDIDVGLEEREMTENAEPTRQLAKHLIQVLQEESSRSLEWSGVVRLTWAERAEHRWGADIEGYSWQKMGKPNFSCSARAHYTDGRYHLNLNILDASNEVAQVINEELKKLKLPENNFNVPGAPPAVNWSFEGHSDLGGSNPYPV